MKKKVDGEEKNETVLINTSIPINNSNNSGPVGRYQREERLRGTPSFIFHWSASQPAQKTLDWLKKTNSFKGRRRRAAFALLIRLWVL